MRGDEAVEQLVLRAEIGASLHARDAGPHMAGAMAAGGGRHGGGRHGGA
jgi:hypothetical protein